MPQEKNESWGQKHYVEPAIDTFTRSFSREDLLMFNSPQADRARLRQWMAEPKQDNRALVRSLFNKAAEEVWQAIGGNGVERKSDEEIARLLDKQRRLMND